MSGKTVPVSVRLSREDAEFIAGLKSDTAVTMSEKVRQLVAEARLASQRAESFTGVIEQTADRLSPVRLALDHVEAGDGARSELLQLMLDWTPRMLAELEAVQAAADPESLKALEARVARRLQGLLDRLARLGVTKESPCFDPEIVRRTLEPLSALFHIIENTHKE